MTDNTTQRDILYCAECSRTVGEQLFITASRADVWLLLEYTGAWGNKALPESDLPAPVKARLEAWQAAVANSKFGFIRAAERGDGLTMFMALPRELDPVLYRLRLDSYEDLLALDLEALARGDARFDSDRTPETVFIVCTNGRRDISCSRYGLPVYNELQQQVGAEVWQTTHIGGHRFAGTLAVLPSGVVYGYLDADDVPDVVTATRSNEIFLANSRGRACYDPPVQAADYFLRGAEGIYALPGVRLIHVDQPIDDDWLVRLEVVASRRHYDVRVRRALSEWTTYQNSNDPTAAHMPQFHLVAYDEVNL